MVTSYALVVPLSRGEEARRFVASHGIGRSDLKLGRRDEQLLIPILEPVPVDIPDASIEVAEFDVSRPPRSYRDVVNVPPGVREHLPSSFDIIGDLVLIKIPDELSTHASEIARAILAAHPNLRGVFADEGVEGPLRVRRLKHLAGENRTRTIHSEFGAKFQVDMAAAYFSPRLANEHQRVAQALLPGETFIDATAGVGPFSVLGARRKITARIVAIDLNPRALQLLRENLSLNRAQDRVELLEGDAKVLLAGLRPFHRVAVNLPHAGEDILLQAWQHIARGGTLHYYVVWPDHEADTLAKRLVDRLSRLTGRPGTLVDQRIVHPYSPRDRLYAVDLSVR